MKTKKQKISLSVPIDLILEILSRLPAKSIARFHCVSKLWESILGRPYFKELFLTRSSARPRLLFAIEKDGVWSFFSLPQRQNPYEKSLVVAAEFHVEFPPDIMQIIPCIDPRYFSCGYASGLIFFYGSRNEGKPLICNPNTGQYVTLPYLKSYRKSYCFFGFDPIEKQFKVLFSPYPSDYHKVLTLETEEKMRWRKIKCSLTHDVESDGICINGILYYLGGEYTSDYNNVITYDYVIVCFDVRYEKFKFIDVEVEKTFELINYKGKLGVISWKNNINATVELRVWVLEDMEKQEWTKYAYSLKDNNLKDADKFSNHPVSAIGVTVSGEIVFSMVYYISNEPFYVFYFNPERNTLQRVEIQGFGEYFNKAFEKHAVFTFADHIEDLNVNDPKLLKSSIYAPYVKTKEEEHESESE